MPNGNENEDDNTKTTGRKQDVPDWKKDVEDLENILESNQVMTDIDELEKLLSEDFSLHVIEAEKDKALDDITDRMEKELPGVQEDEKDEWTRKYENEYDAVTQVSVTKLERSKALLEKKLEKLEHPSWKDKIKAFFKHGAKGIDGEIESVNRKIAATDLALDDLKACLTPEHRREKVDVIKAQLAENRQRLDQRAGHVVGLRLEESMPSNRLKPEDREKAERAVEEGVGLTSVRKQLKEQLKVEKKALKLGEELDEFREGTGIKRRMPK
ncbi:hypothetical protein [Roseimicrobium sp. ORNL1]|uniref:hypothetical protein n=1 Tax=Roseimicrobium sp. ORNL1 TaxID=2711231 RepID=UPI0013E1BE94|nr:hypothetical protein [Roseimicrobium sp. ORNL1]QIF05588.1 hypothetical protein G5S37_30185 [Roseimicrobium sp. ORNL1]